MTSCREESREESRMLTGPQNWKEFNHIIDVVAIEFLVMHWCLSN
jgi:hypothetical protein